MFRRLTKSVSNAFSEAESHRSASIATTMSTDVPDGLLKAVRLDVALERLGSHWSSSSPSASTTSPAVEVTHIDSFISHDWQTGRWAKLAALSFAYNYRAAGIGSVICGAASCYVELNSPSWTRWRSTAGTTAATVDGTYYRPAWPRWSPFAFPVSLVFLLLYWQVFRRYVRCQDEMVFLDKLCINQTDDDLKRQGILALAGFLRHSTRLHVLWSRRYFTRLWCTYELASWVHLGKSMETVDLLPVARAHLVLLLTISLMIVMMIYFFTRVFFEYEEISTIVLILVMGPLLLFLTTAITITARNLVCDMRDMPQQLSHFSIRASKCFCCDVNHRHPDTGQVLQCDREIVYATLRDWYGGSSDAADAIDTDVSVLQFDKLVRDGLSREVAKRAGSKTLRYSYAMFAASPLVWQSVIDMCSFVVTLEPHLLPRLIAAEIVMSFSWAPCSMALAFRIVTYTGTIIGVSRGRCPRQVVDVVVTLLTMLGLALCIFLLWFPMVLAKNMHVAVQVVVTVAYVFLTVVMFFDSALFHLRHSRPSSLRLSALAHGGPHAKKHGNADFQGPGRSSLEKAVLAALVWERECAENGELDSEACSDLSSECCADAPEMVAGRGVLPPRASSKISTAYDHLRFALPGRSVTDKTFGIMAPVAPSSIAVDFHEDEFVPQQLHLPEPPLRAREEQQKEIAAEATVSASLCSLWPGMCDVHTPCRQTTPVVPSALAADFHDEEFRPQQVHLPDTTASQAEVPARRVHVRRI